MFAAGNPPPGALALSVAEMRKTLDAMGVNIPITTLAPKQSIELAKLAISRHDFTSTRSPARRAPCG